MKVCITFEGDLYEDRETFLALLDPHKHECAIEAVDNWLRHLAKYGNVETVLIEEVRDKIREQLE